MVSFNLIVQSTCLTNTSISSIGNDNSPFPPSSVLRLDTTTHTSSTTSSNETDLLSGAGASATSGRLTNVLVVTSSVRMVDRVHAHTSDLRPLVALHSVLVVAATSLQHRLVHTTTSSHNTDHSTATSDKKILIIYTRKESSS